MHFCELASYCSMSGLSVEGRSVSGVALSVRSVQLVTLGGNFLRMDFSDLCILHHTFVLIFVTPVSRHTTDISVPEGRNGPTKIEVATSINNVVCLSPVIKSKTIT